MFSKVTVRFCPSSSVRCTTPSLAWGCSDGTKGPARMTTSGLSLLTTWRRSDIGSKSKFWFVVKGPAAAITLSGFPSCAPLPCCSSSISPALVFSSGFMTPSQTLPATIFLPPGFRPSTPTTWPGKTEKVLSSDTSSSTRLPPADDREPSSWTVVLLSLPVWASLQMRPTTLIVSVLGTPTAQRSFMSKASSICFPMSSRRLSRAAALSGRGVNMYLYFCSTLVSKASVDTLGALGPATPTRLVSTFSLSGRWELKCAMTWPTFFLSS
mmetsp:Transcript_21166/g.42207  ORF Transcript_21166/g.42207 Transcript_21166/m.42207 type:complete len:268 (+) Transcript_21166:743-1546(+)